MDFPGSSVYDTSVGGTKLTLGTGVVYGSETAWANGGGGASAVFAKPGWQTAGASTMRMVPDVSAVADPASSYSAYIQGAWTQAGGTSAAAPAWAAFTALYNQKAETAGKADLGFANPALYQVAGSAKYAAVLHDVTTGSNGDYTATTGYDETTGLGSPIGDGLAAVLGVGANVVTVTSAGNQSTAVGTAVNLAVQAADTGAITGRPTAISNSTVTVTATDNTKIAGSVTFTWTVIGNTVTVTNPGNQSTVVGTAVSLAVQANDSGTGATLTYAATGLPAGLSINATTGAITGKPTATGTSNVVLTVTDNTKSSGTASFTWTVSAASTCTVPGQKITDPGFESGNTGWSASTKVIGEYAAAGEPVRTGTWVARLPTAPPTPTS